jgi:hypothetical protein
MTGAAFDIPKAPAQRIRGGSYLGNRQNTAMSVLILRGFLGFATEQGGYFAAACRLGYNCASKDR